MKERRVERWAGPVYLDASTLVKLFVPKAESDDLNEALIGAEDVVSDLALTETASALGRRTREGLLARRNPGGCTGKQRSSRHRAGERS